MSNLFDGHDHRKNGKPNRLFYGDNLTIMQGMNKGEVDLIYLDPPFNSQRTYNLIYKQLTGLPVPEQEEAFCDAWEIDTDKLAAARKMAMVLRDYDCDESLVKFWSTWIFALKGTQDGLLNYLIYMTYRILEMRRILAPTGSIYLHCDPAASHYIKVMMDGIFGHTNFRSEIIWRRSASHNKISKQYGPIHDTILFYTKSDKFTFHPGRTPYTKSYVEKMFRYRDAKGAFRLNELTGSGKRSGESGKPWRDYDPSQRDRHWAIPASLRDLLKNNGEGMGTHEMLDALDEAGEIVFSPEGRPTYKQRMGAGIPYQDIWAFQPGTAGILTETDLEIDQDVKWLDAEEERLGYQTQKPIGLLKRIIETSTDEGQVVFDPFAGCGTSIYAAHLLKRKWIGCDIAILSVRIVRDVLLKRYGLIEDEHYSVSGVPLSVDGATELFDHDPRQFQHWVVELCGGFVNKRHSGDLGIDGRLYFETHDGLRNMVLSVKGGKLSPANIRELRGVLDREEDSEMAGFICLQEPTKGMLSEAIDAGVYPYLGVDYPRLQIRTVADLLAGRAFETPSKVQTLAWEKQGVLPLQGTHKPIPKRARVR